MEGDRGEQNKKYAKVVAKAWSDESFKESLIADPKAVLAAEGISFPSGTDIKVVEQTDKQLYFVIPPRPEGLSVEEVDTRLAATSVNDFNYCFYLSI
jgi:hypothetical protein